MRQTGDGKTTERKGRSRSPSRKRGCGTMVKLSSLGWLEEDRRRGGGSAAIDGRWQVSKAEMDEEASETRHTRRSGGMTTLSSESVELCDYQIGIIAVSERGRDGVGAE